MSDSVATTSTLASPVKVLIVDDHTGFRRAVTAMIDATEGFVVVGSVSSGSDALDALASSTIDLALVDVHMAPIDGIDVARRHAATDDTAAIVLMSTSALDELADGARGPAVAGFIPKESLSAVDLERVWSSWKATHRRQADASTPRVRNDHNAPS
ncbi:MAG: response regulator [Ilumatobacter sp.]